MPQIIEVPNFGEVEFPDDMSDDDIIKAIKRNAFNYKSKGWDKTPRINSKGSWQDAPLLSTKGTWKDAPIVEDKRKPKYRFVEEPKPKYRFVDDIYDKDIAKSKGSWRNDPIVEDNSKPKPWEQYQDNSKVKYQVTAPDGQKYEVNAPEGATEQDAIQYVQANMYKPKSEASLDPTEGMSTTDKFLAGIGKGMTDLGRGAGQMMRDGAELVSPKSKGLGNFITGGKGADFANKLGLPTQADIKRARELDAPLMNTKSGKVGNIIGQVAPTLLIPGVNGYAGAAAVGGGLGALQPTVAGESRLLNTGFGVAGGVVGQKAGNVISNSITSKVANNALLKAQNITRDATLKASQKAGFKLPRSLYNPSVKSNLVESFGGKAATLQQASASNQKVINNLTRKALDLPDNASLSLGTIDKVRQQAYKPYQEVASISKGAKNALEELKQAKADANAWFSSYNRSANPEHLAKAKDFQATADIAESVLEDYARQAGKGSLILQLKQARKMIAKTYTAERAMNKAIGDIDARVLGRLFDKGKPLSDGFDEIGKFAAAFPKAAQPTQQSAGAGISALDAALATAVGAGGAYGSESPTGAAYGLLPLLLRPATRGIALSKLMQKVPSYGGGLLNMANKASPVLPYVGSRVGGLLGAELNDK